MSYLVRAPFCLLLVVCTASLTWAGFEEGVAAYKREDYATALKEFLPFAEYGEPRSQLIVGEMYRDGQGTTQDYNAALRWFRLSAEQGLSGAQESLGVLYFAGRGVPQDYGEAFKWILLAAEQGVASAQFRPGFMCQNGWGTTQDFVEAHKWYNLAGASGLKDMGELRDNLAKKMTLGQIAEAQNLARMWKPRTK